MFILFSEKISYFNTMRINHRFLNLCNSIICSCDYLDCVYVHTGCSGKIVFFHISLQPLPRLHRCKRHSKPSMQCECTVTPIGW